jgi:hypothetical protein
LAAKPDGKTTLEAGDLRFEVHVHFHGACNGADGAGADAEFAGGVDGGAAEFGMGGEAEIIIGAEVDYLAAIESADGLLFAFEEAQVEIKVLGFQVFERVVQIVQR